MLYRNFGPMRRQIFMGLSCVFAVIILVKSLTPALPSLNANHADKYIHVLAYLVLAVVVLPALPRLRPFYIWVGVAGFGLGVEVLQGLVNTGRSADIYDGIANATGALLAVLIWGLMTRLFGKPSQMREAKRQ